MMLAFKYCGVPKVIFLFLLLSISIAIDDIHDNLQFLAMMVSQTHTIFSGIQYL